MQFPLPGKTSFRFLQPTRTKCGKYKHQEKHFSENTKFASVVLLDKGKPNKNDISNF